MPRKEFKSPEFIQDRESETSDEEVQTKNLKAPRIHVKKTKPAVQRTKGSSSSEAGSVSPIIHRLKNKPVDQHVEKESTEVEEEPPNQSSNLLIDEENDQTEKENKQSEPSVLENISNSSSPQKSGEPTDITSKF